MLKNLLTAAAIAGLMGAGAASAATVVAPISGTIGSAGAFTGQITLDVEGGQAVSGGGTIDILGLSNAPLVLITPSTPGDENNFVNAPVGFRANDGTDYFGLDTAFPVDTNGLLFDVGTSTASFGAYPLLALYSNGDGTFGAAFTGTVNNVDYYNQSGSLTISAGVPEPATWAVMLLGFGAVGASMRRRRGIVDAATA
jgi:hypothetical protein